MGSLGPLVQLEERSAHNRVVPGSNPGRSINNFMAAVSKKESETVE